MKFGSDRLVLLTTLLIDSVLRHEFSSCESFFFPSPPSHNDDGDSATDPTNANNEDLNGYLATASVLEPINLLGLWDVPTDPLRAVESIGIPVDGTVSSQCGVTKFPSNDLMNAFEAEANENEPQRGLSAAKMDSTYKDEMDKYSYGCEQADRVATRGRGGSDDFSPASHDLSPNGNEHQNQDELFDAYTISVSDMYRLEHLSTPSPHETGEIPALIPTLLSILRTAQLHSLAVTQVCVCGSDME
jgi:hypothetical protein